MAKESDAEKQSRRQAEVAFDQQQALLQQQQAFLEKSSAQAQQITDLLVQAEAGNAEAAEAAQQALTDALEGQPNQAQLNLEEEVRLRTQETIRRQLGTGGESSSAGIELANRTEEAIIASRAARQQGDIGAAVGALGATNQVQSTNLLQRLNAASDPLVNTQSLNQSIAGLGKISQFNQPQKSSFLKDLGVGAVSALGSTPNFGGNIGSNVSGISSFLTGNRLGTSFSQQATNAFNQKLKLAKA